MEAPSDVKKKPLIYVAGPYTNPDPVENTRKAINCGAYIYETFGVPTIVPHFTMFSHFLVPREIDYWYKFDNELLLHCHAVFRMPGESNGADDEVALAKEHNIPVFHYYANLKDFVDNPRAWGVFL